MCIFLLYPYSNTGIAEYLGYKIDWATSTYVCRWAGCREINTNKTQFLPLLEGRNYEEDIKTYHKHIKRVRTYHNKNPTHFSDKKKRSLYLRGVSNDWALVRWCSLLENPGLELTLHHFPRPDPFHDYCSSELIN